MLFANSCRCSVEGETIRQSSQSSRVRNPTPLFFSCFMFSFFLSDARFQLIHVLVVEVVQQYVSTSARWPQTLTFSRKTSAHGESQVLRCQQCLYKYTSAHRFVLVTCLEEELEHARLHHGLREGWCVRLFCLAPNLAATNSLQLWLPLGWRKMVTGHDVLPSSWGCTVELAAIAFYPCPGLPPGLRYAPTSWDSALAERRGSSVLLLRCCACAQNVLLYPAKIRDCAAKI